MRSKVSKSYKSSFRINVAAIEFLSKVFLLIRRKKLKDIQEAP